MGWRTWEELTAGINAIPARPLVYVVYRPSGDLPGFRELSSGGHFKGRDPTVPVETLRVKWVDGAHTINIGKADVGRPRLKSYARFGAGEPVAHWGGRYIWQLVESPELLVAWHEIDWDETAREYESRLLARFRGLHDGRLPFANLTN